MSSVVAKFIGKGLQKGAKAVWGNVRDATPKLFRFAVLADSAIGLGQNTFNADGKHNQNKTKAEVWTDTALYAAELGLSIYAMRAKGSRKLLNKIVAGTFIADQARKTYNDLNRPLTDEQKAQFLADKKQREDCKEDIAFQALFENARSSSEEVGKQVNGVFEMAAPVKVGGQFFRAGVNLFSTVPNAPRFYAERKFGIGAIEPGFRAGYKFNADEAAVSNAGMSASAMKLITNTWGNNAFVGNETILSLRPANARLHSSNGFEREDVHEAKLFSGFGIFNHDRSRALTLEADARLRVPATKAALAQAPRDLATMLGWRDAKVGEDPKLQFSANLRIIGKLTYNPLVVDANGNFQTQTPWQFIKSAFSVGKPKKPVPQFKVAVSGSVVDVSTQQGQSLFENSHYHKASQFGTLLAQNASNIDDNDNAFASNITLKLPQDLTAVQDHYIGKTLNRRGSLEQVGDAKIMYYDRYGIHGERFNTREVLSVNVGGKTYYTVEGIKYLVEKKGEETGLSQLKDVSHGYIRKANKEALVIKKINGMPMYLVEAGSVIDFGAYAQGANCVGDSNVEGLFMREGSRYNFEKPKTSSRDSAPVVKNENFVEYNRRSRSDNLIPSLNFFGI